MFCVCMHACARVGVVGDCMCACGSGGIVCVCVHVYARQMQEKSNKEKRNEMALCVQQIP